MTQANDTVVLALNSGSSSLKFGLYRAGSASTEMLFSGEAESIGGETGDFQARDVAGNTLMAEKSPLAGYSEAIARIASLLTQFATVTRRDSAENTGKDLPERSDTFLAFSQQAVRAIQGRGRITAKLL